MNVETKLKILLLVTIIVLIGIFLSWAVVAYWIGSHYGAIAGFAAVILPIFAVCIGAILFWEKKGGNDDLDRN